VNLYQQTQDERPDLPASFSQRDADLIQKGLAALDFDFTAKPSTSPEFGDPNYTRGWNEMRLMMLTHSLASLASSLARRLKIREDEIDELQAELDR